MPACFAGHGPGDRALVRSALLSDRAGAVARSSRPSLFAIFALDGFKDFDELYGVLEARKLLGGSRSGSST